MKVLVTGAAGQVGRALIAGAPRGVEIAALPRTGLDIGDAAAVAAAVRRTAPDLIVNAAAYTAVDRAESEPGLARRVNAEGAANLAAAAAAIGARLVQLSTDLVFDGENPRPYGPDAAPAPLGVYGATKLAGERGARERLPGASIVLRTARVYSAGGRNFLARMLERMRTGDAIRVVADQIGSPTAAHSLAEAVWALGLRPDVTGTWHWTDSGVASWYDFAVAIAEEAAALGLVPAAVRVVPVATADYPTPARRPPCSVLDTRATREAIGVVPPHWRANLRQVLGELERG